MKGDIMDWGLKNRLARIIKPDTGKTVMLAVDHGYFLGPTSGLEVPSQTIKPLLPYADSLMLTRGVLRTSVSADFDIPIVLRVSGGTSILSKDLSNEGITTSIREAIRLNVCAIAVLTVTAVGREMTRDAKYLSLCCRIAAEMGAHFVKTYYCEDFEKVVETCPVPVVIAGGKKIPEKDALQLAHNAISHGASGVDMGRNIFQSDSPVGMIRAVKAIVHKGISVEEAYKMYEGSKKT
jgi:putative autoinducer-2 (AI-2) aldolase